MKSSLVVRTSMGKAADKGVEAENTFSQKHAEEENQTTTSVNPNQMRKSLNKDAIKTIAPLDKSSTKSEVLELVNDRYQILQKLGQGSFGEVRLANDVQTATQVAIKFEHKSDLKRHLRTEYDVYSAVQGPGFPTILWFGKHGDYTALVMERCGQSLKTLYARCNRIFPVQTVALIAIQLLDRLETLHNHGWLHQDIKPENIVVGVGEAKSTLYMIDYGTSGMYIDPVTKKHQTRGPSTKIVGTARYSSLNNHYGYKQSRRDDLESLGYTLIYWLLGRLPWQGIPEKDFRVKWKKVRRIKRAITPDELCRGLPVQFRIFMKYVFKLSYAQRPNYGYLRGLFRQLINTENESAMTFAWEKFGLTQDDSPQVDTD